MRGQLSAVGSQHRLSLDGSAICCLAARLRDVSPSGVGVSASTKVGVEVGSPSTDVRMFWSSGTSGPSKMVSLVRVFVVVLSS